MSYGVCGGLSLVWWPVTCVLKEGCECMNYLATHPQLCHMCVEGRLCVCKPLNHSHLTGALKEGCEFMNYLATHPKLCHLCF